MDSKDMGKVGGRIGGKSRSPAKVAAGQKNIAKARAVKAAKLAAQKNVQPSVSLDVPYRNEWASVEALEGETKNVQVP